jgi:DNA-binding transcriptional MerR regulator
MKEYSTKDIANIVGIASPTVRKYAQALEKEGYTFIKNENGFRIFTDNDIQIFEQMKQMSNESGMNVYRIASILVNQQTQNETNTIHSESEVATPARNKSEKETLSDIERIDRRYESLLKEIQELKEMMMLQQKYIDERLEKRDEILMQSIRSLQEQKQTLLEASTTKEKKGFFARLFSKKN